MVIPVYCNQFGADLKSQHSSCVNRYTCSLALCMSFIFAINLPPADTTSSIFACGGFLSRYSCRRVELDVILILVPAKESRLWKGGLGTTFLGWAFWRRWDGSKKDTKGHAEVWASTTLLYSSFPICSSFVCKSLQLASDWVPGFQQLSACCRYMSSFWHQVATVTMLSGTAVSRGVCVHRMMHWDTGRKY